MPVGFEPGFFEQTMQGLEPPAFWQLKRDRHMLRFCCEGESYRRFLVQPIMIFYKSP